MWESFIQAVTNINSAINSVVWGVPMLVLIIGTGILMTCLTGFFQLRKAKHVTRETFLAIFRKKSGVTKSREKTAISQFQALSTALAATIGTGNIAGVATAITIGGPGAVFWMWLSAFFGMMTNYSENVLGIYYRKKNEAGEWSGGAMYYLQEGLKDKPVLGKLAKPLGILFAIFCVMASFGIGNMSQINSISSAMYSNFSIPSVVTGVVLALIAALVILGGIKRIAQVTERLVPFMAVFYIIGALIIFFMNFRQIPYVFSSIFRDAFNFTSIAGGVGGVVIKRAVTMGFKRGVFSNEAGLGSSVMVHSASNVKEPVKQGMWGIFEVFFDTIVVCTLTAFVLLSCTTTGVVSLDEALSQVTPETQYFVIANGGEYDGQEVHLIDSDVNEAVRVSARSTGETLTAEANGQQFSVPTLASEDKGENDYIYTNLMTLTGTVATDSSGAALLDDEGNPIIASVQIEEVEGVSLVTYAFGERFGPVAGKLVSIAVLLFAFSTVLGWSFYGTKALEFLFGTKATVYYKIIFIIFIVIGATMSLDLAWDISDTLNGLMALPNLIGVVALSGVVVRITRNYSKRRFNGEDIEPMLSAYEDIQKVQAEALKRDGE
ncbi:MAG: alanine/glycine:cation symporter family protein [Clostridia bacterium]|nr:alanine/glycine:cation symporter family protein [Clostridia bacterium]